LQFFYNFFSDPPCPSTQAPTTRTRLDCVLGVALEWSLLDLCFFVYYTLVEEMGEGRGGEFMAARPNLANLLIEKIVLWVGL
jgi:hypothetical protein